MRDLSKTHHIAPEREGGGGGLAISSAASGPQHDYSFSEDPIDLQDFPPEGRRISTPIKLEVTKRVLKAPYFEVFFCDFGRYLINSASNL